MSAQRNRRVAFRLVLEGFAVALMLAVGMWGVLTLGRQAVVTERHYYSPVASITVVDAMVCLEPDTPKGRAEAAIRAGNGTACPSEFRPLTTTSRQPGGSSSRRSAPLAKGPAS